MLESKDGDLMLMSGDEECWGVSGIGISVQHIPFSREKVSKLPLEPCMYEWDTFLLSEELLVIALNKGYSFLSTIDSGIHCLFYCDYSTMIDEKVEKETIVEAIVDVLTEVSKESKEELRKLIGVVGLGGLES